MMFKIVEGYFLFFVLYVVVFVMFYLGFYIYRCLKKQVLKQIFELNWYFVGIVLNSIGLLGKLRINF